MTVRFALAEREAIDLLNTVRIVKVPVDLERIAEFFGAEVRREPDFADDFSGMVYRADGHAIIAVNKHHSLNRQRFTLAHEIGHLVLHADEALHVDGTIVGMRDPRASQGTSDKEIEANIFAAHLLMPSHFLAKDLRKGFDIEDDQLVGQLARKYKVSVQAMSLRLAAYARTARL